MIIREVVHCILTHNDSILLLKRSQKVGSQKGKWAGVTGFLDNNDPLKQAFTEIAEELSLAKEDVKLLKADNFKDSPDLIFDDKIWRVHPFLFEVIYPEKIKLDWEHDELKWIKIEDLVNYDTMVDFEKLLKDILEL